MSEQHSESRLATVGSFFFFPDTEKKTRMRKKNNTFPNLETGSAAVRLLIKSSGNRPDYTQRARHSVPEKQTCVITTLSRRIHQTADLFTPENTPGRHVGYVRKIKLEQAEMFFFLSHRWNK